MRIGMLRETRRDREARCGPSPRRPTTAATTRSRRAVRPQAGAAAAPADLDRGRRRAAHAARRGAPRRPRRTSVASPTSSRPQVRGAEGPLQGRRARLRRDPQDVVTRGVRPRDRGRDDGGGHRGRFWGEPFESWTRRQPRRHARAGRASSINAYRELGCSGFVPWCSDYPDTETLTLLAEKVIPQFR